MRSVASRGFSAAAEVYVVYVTHGVQANASTSCRCAAREWTSAFRAGTIQHLLL